MDREFVDSREGWDVTTAAEYETWMDDCDGDDGEEYARDLLLEQQEWDDFDETDEAYGYYGGDDPMDLYDFD